MENKEEFKMGDTVRLKSGGPVMTINRTTTGETVECMWMDGDSLQKRDIIRFALEKCDPPKKGPTGGIVMGTLS